MKTALKFLLFIAVIVTPIKTFCQIDSLISSVNANLPRLEEYIVNAFRGSKCYNDTIDYTIHHCIWVDYTGDCTKSDFANKTFLNHLTPLYYDRQSKKKKTYFPFEGYIMTNSTLCDRNYNSYISVDFNGTYYCNLGILRKEFTLVENPKLMFIIKGTRPIFIIDQNDNVSVYYDAEDKLYSLSEFIESKWDGFLDPVFLLMKKYQK